MPNSAVLEPVDPVAELVEFVHEQLKRVVQAIPELGLHIAGHARAVHAVVLAHGFEVVLDAGKSVVGFAHGISVGRASDKRKCQACAGVGLRLVRVGERVGWAQCPECKGAGRV